MLLLRLKQSSTTTTRHPLLCKRSCHLQAAALLCHGRALCQLQQRRRCPADPASCLVSRLLHNQVVSAIAHTRSSGDHDDQRHHLGCDLQEQTQAQQQAEAEWCLLSDARLQSTAEPRQLLERVCIIRVLLVRLRQQIAECLGSICEQVGAVYCSA